MSYPNIEDVSPMMQEYLRTKQQYPDCLLFYRLGDFYEMFFDDAEITSRELDLTLTGKACGLPERAPMCGIPFHAVDIYIAKLIEKGYRVAVCEQVEDPRQAKGLVRREVTHIVTPGTNVSPETLDDNRNNYILSIYYTGVNGKGEKRIGKRGTSSESGIAVSDISTGDFYVTQLSGRSRILDEIIQYSPSEIICNEAFLDGDFDLEELRSRLDVTITGLDRRYYAENECNRILLQHFRVSSLMALGIDGMQAGTIAAGALLRYLQEMQMNDLRNITGLQAYLSGRYMLLDTSTRRNLELVQTLREKKTQGSLLWVLDRTRTAMGARLLRRFLEQPLVDKDAIEQRFDALQELSEHSVDRDELREYLGPVYDLERLLAKISCGSANPRDLSALGSSLEMIRPMRQVMDGFASDELVRIRGELGEFDELVSLLKAALTDEPPLAMKEGGIIRDGYDADIDACREAKTNSRQLLAQMESRVREETGIRNLKIKFNNVFGYFFEVSNSYKSMVPDSFERRQTLVGSERYTTPELKELEDRILGAQDRLCDLEYEAFDRLRRKVADEIGQIQSAARAIAYLDVYASLSLVSERNGYVRPSLNEKGIIRIRDGRHPVVEQMMQGEFVPNDTLLDNKSNQIAIITGPNMAGKSTYMRQTALIVLMSQIGCFVPARSANLCVVDRIFTRVGASDDLGSGQSTFMVEMNEVANILRNATKDSLLILDEIGRGTSTFDGLSIAWAVIEYIANRKILGAKTLFATHYHELSELEGRISNVNNYCIAVQEQGDDIVFLRRITKGGADRSYGIQVARLAGVPDMVIERAKEIASQLSDNDIAERIQSIEVKAGEGKAAKAAHYDEVDLGQMSFQAAVPDEDVLKELKELDVSNMTPIDALNTLYRLQSQLNNRWSVPIKGKTLLQSAGRESFPAQ